MRARVVSAALAACLCLCGPAHADEPEFKYALGLQLSNQPEYPGSAQRQTSVSPVWALQWGRLHISTGGGSMLMGFGSNVYGPGASTDLVRNKDWRVGLSLRLDGGRNSSDTKATQGLPDVRRTVRGRLFASYQISKDVQLNGALSQDLLGRGGGLIASTDLSWRFYRTARSEWSSGVGLNAADGTQMRSYFGVRPEDVQSSGLPAYQPGAGLRDVWLGVGYTRMLDKHWIINGSSGVSRLLGPAADSPLTQRPAAAQVMVRLAYRR
jgi:outer membrane scaffolding protein for murein synthesis (MipA/OmpV family)